MSTAFVSAPAVNSRDADKFVARLPEGMRELIKARGKADSRSMNGVVIQALAQYLSGEQVVTTSTAIDELVEALLERIQGKVGQTVTKQ